MSPSTMSAECMTLCICHYDLRLDMSIIDRLTTKKISTCTHTRHEPYGGSGKFVQRTYLFHAQHGVARSAGVYFFLHRVSVQLL